MAASDIIMPDAQASGESIREAWHNFLRQAKEEGGWTIKAESIELAEAIFVSGYCAGHNDCLDIIRGQQQTVDLLNGIFNNKKQ